MEIALYVSLGKEVPVEDGHFLTVRSTTRRDRVHVKLTRKSAVQAHVGHRHLAARNKRIDNQGADG
jgi:hypothetical protein